MFLVPNIDQMYKEMKKIVEVGNKHGNGDEFPDFVDIYIFFWHKNVRVGRWETHILFFLTLLMDINSFIKYFITFTRLYLLHLKKNLIVALFLQK
jgi:hypothetical protein